MNATAATRAALVSLLLAPVACGDSEPGDDGASGGSSHAGTSGRGGSGGSLSGAGGSASGAAGDSSSGAGGSGAGKGGSAGNPGKLSPECISPCLNELLSACRPTQSCTLQELGDPLEFVECEAASGYRREGDLDPPTGDPAYVVEMNGQLCYRATLMGDTWSFFTPDDVLRATLTVGIDADSGRCPLLEAPGSQPVIYPIDLQDARCAAVMCTEGTCP